MQIVVRLRTFPNNWHPPEVLWLRNPRPNYLPASHFQACPINLYCFPSSDLVFWPSHPISSPISYDSRALFFFFLHVSLRPSILGVLFEPDIFHSRFDHVVVLTMFIKFLRLPSDAAKILMYLYPSVTLIFQAVGFKHAVKSLGHSATSYCWTFSLPVSEVPLPFLLTPNTLVFLPPLHKVSARSINLHPIRAPHCTPFIKLLV